MSQQAILIIIKTELRWANETLESYSHAQYTATSTSGLQLPIVLSYAEARARQTLYNVVR